MFISKLVLISKKNSLIFMNIFSDFEAHVKIYHVEIQRLNQELEKANQIIQSLQKELKDTK